MPRLLPAVFRRLATAVGACHAAANLEVPGRVQPLLMTLHADAARAGTSAVLGRCGRSLRDLSRNFMPP